MMAASSASRRTPPPNQDLPRQPSLISASSLTPLISDNAAAASLSMDDLLKNIYAEADAPDAAAVDPPPLFPSGGNDAGRTVDDVWKDIVAGTGRHHLVDGGAGDQQVTLEDFLYRARTPGVGDATVAAAAGPETVAAVGPPVVVNGGLIQPQGGQLAVVGGPVGGVGRGKRRAQVQEEPPFDKATQQKQRRMIKNRESAARSRERKQAYTAELESLVTQLEEENARLLREEAEMKKEMLAKIINTVVPVTEGKRPPRTLRRVQSM